MILIACVFVFVFCFFYKRKKGEIMKDEMWLQEEKTKIGKGSQLEKSKKEINQ